MFRQWKAKQDVDRADGLIDKDVVGSTALKMGYTCSRDMANSAAEHYFAPQPTSGRRENET
jgi:hypothetical protein